MPRGCVLPPELVGCRDVPADGNCLFHALGIEIRRAFPGAKLPPNTDGKAPGAGWRAYLLQFATQNPQHLVEDFTVEELINACQGCDVATYCRSMESAASWGGFLEASILAHAWGQDLAVILLQATAEGHFHVMAWLGPTGEGVRPIYAVWLQNHWQRARLRADGFRIVRAWRLEVGPSRSRSTKKPLAASSR